VPGKPAARPAALLAALLLVAGCRPAGAPAEPAAGTPAGRILAEGRRILANARRTAYSHIARVDESGGRYELDCSALAALILRNAAPEHLEAVRRASGRSRPRAAEFQSFFEAAPDSPGGREGWRRVPSLAEARPGDFLAWRQELAEDNTGHIVLLLAAPVPERQGQEPGTPPVAPDGAPGSWLWRVAVLDATSAPHAEDSRPAGASGVGRGTMWFRTDSAGRPAAFLWSRAGGQGAAVPIAIGRAVAPECR